MIRRLVRSRAAASLLALMVVLAGPAWAEPAAEVRIANGGQGGDGQFAQDLAQVLAVSFASRLRVVPLQSGTEALALADLCAGKAELAVLPSRIVETETLCPRRKNEAKKRGLRLVIRLGDDAAAEGGAWLLVGTDKPDTGVETLVALMFPNMDVLASGSRKDRWAGANVFADQPGVKRDNSAALWVAGIRERCSARASDSYCATLDGGWK
ncbi:MAG: hypothetical protein AB7G62_00625 [Magnetospirillum sp.]